MTAPSDNRRSPWCPSVPTLGLDAADCVGLVVGDPDRPRSRGDAERPLADRDRGALDAPALLVDAADGVVVVVRHPHRAEAGDELARVPAHADRPAERLAGELVQAGDGA